MLRDKVSDTAAPFLGKLRGMGSRYDAVLWMLRQMPRRVQNAPIGRFGSARRHEYHQTIDIAVRDLFQLVDQQPMMRGRFKAAVAAPLS